jgi:hypothetical protein
MAKQDVANEGWHSLNGSEAGPPLDSGDGEGQRRDRDEKRDVCEEPEVMRDGEHMVTEVADEAPASELKQQKQRGKGSGEPAEVVIEKTTSNVPSHIQNLIDKAAEAAAEGQAAGLHPATLKTAFNSRAGHRKVVDKIGKVHLDPQAAGTPKLYEFLAATDRMHSALELEAEQAVAGRGAGT